MESLVLHLMTWSDVINCKCSSFFAKFANFGEVVNWKMQMPQKHADLFAAMGARLTIARNEIGFSQAAMAEAIGVSPRAYHSYEKGQRGMPVEALVAMGEQFEVDVPWLLLGTKSIRAGHDFEALKHIESSLDKHLTDEGIKIKSEKRGAIVARWYQSHVEGREVSNDDVHTWIELVRE